MKSLVQTGPNLQVKIIYTGAATEKTIGYATDLNYTVIQGQKMIFTVDSPFPAEIAQAASTSYVRGSMGLFLPKASTLESLGLVPYRSDKQTEGGAPLQAASGYFTLKIYDRQTTKIVLTLDYCKISAYTVSVAARSVVRVSVSFEGMLATPGNRT